MNLVNEALGSEGSVSVDLSGGKLSLSAKYDSKGLDGEVKLSVDSDYFLDKLAEAIPGKLDDAVIAVLKAALKQL